MDRQELISVIVPVYNVEKYLRRCIDSIINQTYKNLEIILVDDGSPDSSGAICDEYAKKDSRIKVIHKENSGLSGARNAGIDAATGEYISFIDSDDYVNKDFCMILYKNIKADNSDICICGFEHVTEPGSFIEKNAKETISTKQKLRGKQIISDYMMKVRYENMDGYWAIACNKLYKANLFSNIRYPIGRLHEDEFVIHNLLDNTDFVSVLSDKLYYYTQRPDSIMGKKSSFKHIDKAKALIERADFLKRRGYADDVIYRSLMGGINSAVNIYGKCGASPERSMIYREMVREYRRCVREFRLTDLSWKKKLRMYIVYAVPYMAETIYNKIKRNK